MRAMVAPRDKATGKRWGGEDNFYYQCPPKQQGGCGGVGRSGPTIDAMIEAAFLTVMQARAGAVEGDEDDAWTGVQALADVRERINALQAAWKAKEIGNRFFSMLSEAEAEEKALLAERRAWLAQRQILPTTPGNIRAEWAAASVERRRALLSDRLAAVVVHPLKPKMGEDGQSLLNKRTGKPIFSRIFDPSLIEPEWLD